MKLFNQIPDNVNITVSKQDLIDLVNICLLKNIGQQKYFPEYLSIKHLSEYLSYSEAAIYKMVAKSVIPFFKIGGKLLFNRKEIDSWLLEYKKPTINSQVSELDLINK